MPTSAASRKTWSPAQITRRSKSNLALALVCLPEDRRRDMTTYYAFCRAVDDIADDHDVPREEKEVELAHWCEVINGETPASTELEEATLAVKEKYGMQPTVFLELIEGMRMDLDVVRYETWEDLRRYCYRVAGVVGIACATIFGYRNPQSLRYGVSVGYSLQVTNIMRDVHEDYTKDDRIYLPQEDLQASGYTEEDISSRRYNEAFIHLMDRQFDRALHYYKEAAMLLPPEDRTNMLTLQTMSRLYYRILRKMKADGYRIYDRRYGLSRAEKALILGRAMATRWIVGN